MAAAARPSSRAAQAGAADHRQAEGEAVWHLLVDFMRGSFGAIRAAAYRSKLVSLHAGGV